MGASKIYATNTYMKYCGRVKIKYVIWGKLCISSNIVNITVVPNQTLCAHTLILKISNLYIH